MRKLMKTKIKVNGMTCQHCSMRVKNALLEIDEVTSVDVDLNSGEVTIEQNSDQDLKLAFSEVVNEAGYSVV